MIVSDDPNIRCRFTPITRGGYGRLVVEFPSDAVYLDKVVTALFKLIKRNTLAKAGTNTEQGTIRA